MNNLNDCISYLNCRINALEQNLDCLISYIKCSKQSNLVVGYGKPNHMLGMNKNIYIQLDGGIFYEKINNKWNVLGNLTPLLIDGGVKLNNLREDLHGNTN